MKHLVLLFVVVLNVTATAMNIGRRAYPSFNEPMNGGIDEVIISSRAWSAGEISTYYSNPITPP